MTSTGGCGAFAWVRHVMSMSILVLAIAASGAVYPTADAGESGMGGFLGEGIDFKGGMLDWEEDDEGHRVAILRNYAVVILPQLTISARNMVLNVELQEIYAEGDVVFDEAGGNSFYCDQITFNYQEWTGLAKNIRVKVENQGVTVPVRDFLDQQPSASMRDSSSLNDFGDNPNILKRMYAQGSELRAHDYHTFELIDAKITPSAFAKPHWYFRSPAAILRRKEKVEAYHNTVNVGRFPLLYFPYLIRDLQYDWPWMRFTGGYTGDYGVFARTQWGWRLAERPNAYLKMNKIIFDVDWFSRRGVGLGVETTYKVGDLDSLGKLKIYGVYEYAISKGRDLERAQEDNEDKIYWWHPNYEPSLYRKDMRWAIDWEHYQQLNELWDVRAEVHLYHDRDYLKDYDSNRYWSAKEPENSIDVRRLDKHWELEFVASSRLSNKWQTAADYYPEVRLTVPGYQLGNTPLIFKDDFRMGIVNKHFDEDEVFFGRDQAWGLFQRDPVTGLSASRLHEKGDYGTMFRAFNEATLELPLQMWNIFTLKPWIGLRTAYYSETLGTPKPYNEMSPTDQFYHYWGIYTPGQLGSKGDGSTYYAVPMGVDLSTRTYTLFGAHEQWRLITEPVVSYLENARPKLNSKRDLYPIDYYDEYAQQRRIGVELHNKLQRRYYEHSSPDLIPQRDVLDLNLAGYHYPREKDRDEVNYGFKWSELVMDVVFRPTARLALSASVDYDLHDNTVNRGMFSADWRLGSLFRIYMAHYHYRGNYWRYRYADPSSETYLALRTKLWNDSSRYSVEGAVGYEWRDSNEWQTSRTGVRHGFNKYRFSLYRDMDTFEMSISYMRNRNEDDHGVFFNLAPKSFMGYERPQPSYSVEVDTLADGRYPEAVRYLGSGYPIDGPVADADLKDVQF